MSEEKTIKEKYYLYLDESGNFWEDDPSDRISPSLIGGVLCTKELANEDVAQKVHSDVVQDFIKKHPQYKNADFNHATEAVAQEDKPDLKLRMVEAITKNGYIPVVFQQKGKFFIETNTTTYIMFLVEGIIKLIEDRQIKNLTVVIGERLDLDKKEAWLKKHPDVSEKAYRELISQRKILFLSLTNSWQ